MQSATTTATHEMRPCEYYAAGHLELVASKQMAVTSGDGHRSFRCDQVWGMVQTNATGAKTSQTLSGLRKIPGDPLA